MLLWRMRRAELEWPTMVRNALGHRSRGCGQRTAGL